MKDMPDLGENMLDWFTIIAFMRRAGRMDGEVLGRDCCDYWYVGDRSPVLKDYEGPEIYIIRRNGRDRSYTMTVRS